MKEDQLPNFSSIEERVFTSKGGNFYIGTQEISPEIKSLLKDQAKGVLSMQLYEIIRATIQHEAAQLALIQSTDFQQVLFAKALWHWQEVMDRILNKLTKND